MLMSTMAMDLECKTSQAFNNSLGFTGRAIPMRDSLQIPRGSHPGMETAYHPRSIEDSFSHVFPVD